MADLNELLGAKINIPTMPSVLARVMQRLNDESASVADIAQAIRNDQGLTTRILRLANSPLYGLSRSVDTPQQAIVMLGTKSIRSLVIGESSRTLYQQNNEFALQLQEHAIGVAIAAHVVADRMRLGIADQAFVAGLLHDVGKVLLVGHDPAAYAELDRRRIASDQTAFQAEQAAYSLDHAQVGAALIERWALPKSLECALRFHHDVESALADDTDNTDLICVVRIADLMCHKLGIGTGRPPRPIEIDKDLAAQTLGIEPTEIAVFLQETDALFEKERGIFG